MNTYNRTKCSKKACENVYIKFTPIMISGNWVVIVQIRMGLLWITHVQIKAYGRPAYNIIELNVDAAWANAKASMAILMQTL